MDKQNGISELIKEAERVSGIEKCRTCQCFTDTLMEFKEVLEKRDVSKAVKERLAALAERAEVTHNCLGCDPCYPVPLSNDLAEMLGRSSARLCGPACKPAPSLSLPLPFRGRGSAPSWPVEQGEYIVGNKAAPVAVSTLSSDDLPALISEQLGSNLFALVGKTHTENIGIEKVVKNTISNPNIRFLILCGKDSKGHRPGQSQLSLAQEGVNHEHRIIGSEGRRPVLKNLDLSEIEHFRAQVEIIDLIGSEDITGIEKTVQTCLERNPGRFCKIPARKKAPLTEAQTPGRLVLDPSGFFIIYPKKEEGRIYLEHYRKDGTLNEILYGDDPVLIASTAIERRLLSRLDHAAYLGRELEKAYLSMCYGFPYVQDGMPGKEGG